MSRKRFADTSSVRKSLSQTHRTVSLRSKVLEFEDQEYMKEGHDKLRDQVEVQTKALNESRWWERTRQLLQDAIHGREVVALHCLGLGSFVNSKSSSYQMACALLIRRTFTQTARCTMADPVMGATDRAFTDEKGFCIIDTARISERDTSKEVKIAEVHAVEKGKCVLWFMPHCTRQLYDMVLADYGAIGYEGMVILGNKFSEYSTTDKDGMESQTLDRLNEEKRFIERDCSNSELSPYPHAFNTLGVMTVKNEKELRD